MSQADSLRHIADLWDAMENEIEQLQRERDACRGALGYSMPGDFDGRLPDGTFPVNGIAVALNQQLEAAAQSYKDLEVEVAVLLKAIQPADLGGAGYCSYLPGELEAIQAIKAVLKGRTKP